MKVDGKIIAGAGLGLLAAAVLSLLFPGPPISAPAPTGERTAPRVRTVTQVKRVVEVIIPRGFTAVQVAAALRQGGVIADAGGFLARAGAAAQSFRAGVYRFQPGEAEGRVLLTLQGG